MNSKIKELYFPIWKNYSITIGTSENNPDYGFAYTTDYQEELFHSNMEKFAELIVKECAKVSENYACGSMPYSISLAIKNHFGIEE